MDWKQFYIQLLCNFLKRWNIDCSGINDEQTAGPIFVQAYKDYGAPTLTTAAQVDAYVDLLDRLDAHLDHPDNCIPPVHTADLLNTTSSLRRDLLDT